MARVDGKVTFVTGALPGERVRARYTRRRSRYDEALVEEVFEPSGERVVPACRHFARCGGCSAQHHLLPAQLAAKERYVFDSLRTIGGMSPERVLEAIPGTPWAYRRRARLGVRYVPAKAGVLVGFREYHDGRIAELDRCLVLAEPVGEMIQALREAVGRLSVRHRVAQIEVAVGDNAVALVFRHLAPLTGADRDLLCTLAADLGVQVYLQPAGPPSIEALAPTAPEPLYYELPEFDLRVYFSPGDFVQVHAQVNAALVARVIDVLALESGMGVLDLFCGLGNFSLPMACRGARVYGVEGEPGLVERARANARANRLTEAASFEQGDLSDARVLDDLLARPVARLVLDPPRSGAAAVVAAMRAPYPARVVYVSCDPATLARDARELATRHGYRLTAAGVADMFPHTRHVETVAVFDRPPSPR